jgi:membrane-associated phospholipid phosphatase
MTSGLRALTAASTLALALLGARSGHAAEPDDGALRWKDEWPRFRPVEYVVTGVLGPAALAEYFIVPAQSQPHWYGGVLFDDTVRDALRVRSPSGLRAVRAASDALGALVVVWAVGVDSFVVPLLRGSPAVAAQGTLVDVETYSISSLVAVSLYDTIGRTRPSYFDCQKDPSVDAQCSISPTASFPSGHVNEAFTAAGLSCANHAYLRPYGGRFADGFACGRDLVLAGTDGVLRIMGDRHYTTDVLVGGAMGFAFGYGLPVLLHYRVPGRSAGAVTFVPMSGAGVGLVAMGIF